MLFTFCISLTACGNKCEHTYDNACDAICNDCGETREVSAHQWNDATCTTLKTCTVCGAVTTPAKLEHIAHADDGDCTTPITCTECGWLIVPAWEHNFSGDWKTDADGRWHVCQNTIEDMNCKVAGTKKAHNKGEDGKCTVCGYFVEVIDPHEHSYTIADYTYNILEKQHKKQTA